MGLGVKYPKAPHKFADASKLREKHLWFAFTVFLHLSQMHDLKWQIFQMPEVQYIRKTDKRYLLILFTYCYDPLSLIRLFVGTQATYKWSDRLKNRFPLPQQLDGAWIAPPLPVLDCP